MDRALWSDVSGHDGVTYAEPLAGLRVSWGAILAGALALVAVTTFLVVLASAIVLSLGGGDTGSARGGALGLGIASIVSTLIGAGFAGALAGYLPGNRSPLLAAVHGFLAWALAFVVTTPGAFGMFRGMVPFFEPLNDQGQAPLVAIASQVTWAWFGTWLAAGLIAIFAGVAIVRTLGAGEPLSPMSPRAIGPFT